MNIILILVAIILLVLSSWLFYKVKPKKRKIEFIHEEPNKLWTVTETNYWTNLKAYTRANFRNFIYASIFSTILIVSVVYHFYGESALGTTAAILLAVWGAICSSLFVGSSRPIVKISNGTEDIFKVIKETVENIKEIFVKDKNESIIYSGYIELPSRIYLDESANIIINLFGEISSTKLNREYIELAENEELKLIDIHLQRKQNTSEFLGVELQAASLKIDGKTNQQVNLVNKNIKFQWSVSSEKPTYHKMTLIFSKLSESVIKNFGEIEHSIKVVNLFGLTRRQLLVSAVISGLSGLLGLVVAVEKVLKVLGEN